MDLHVSNLNFKLILVGFLNPFCKLGGIVLVI